MPLSTLAMMLQTSDHASEAYSDVSSYTTSAVDVMRQVTSSTSHDTTLIEESTSSSNILPGAISSIIGTYDDILTSTGVIRNVMSTNDVAHDVIPSSTGSTLNALSSANISGGIEALTSSYYESVLTFTTTDDWSTGGDVITSSHDVATITRQNVERTENITRSLFDVSTDLNVASKGKKYVGMDVASRSPDPVSLAAWLGVGSAVCLIVIVIVSLAILIVTYRVKARLRRKRINSLNVLYRQRLSIVIPQQDGDKLLAQAADQETVSIYKRRRLEEINRTNPVEDPDPCDVDLKTEGKDDGCREVEEHERRECEEKAREKEVEPAYGIKKTEENDRVEKNQAMPIPGVVLNKDRPPQAPQLPRLSSKDLYEEDSDTCSIDVDPTWSVVHNNAFLD